METDGTTNGDERRRTRENNIRQHSERYGLRFSSDNAHRLGPALKRWRVKDNTVANEIPIRVYNRDKNVMYMTTLKEVFDALLLDVNGNPQRLTPTPFGQIILTPTLYLSSSIYTSLVVTWYACFPGEETANA